MGTSRVVSIDRWLFVEDPWELTSDGKDHIQRLWPLAAKSAENVQLIGQPAVYDNGLFLVGEGMFKRKFQMLNGPATKCTVNLRRIRDN